MHLRVDPHAALPPSRQMVLAIADAVACGELAPGARLPSVRQAAAEALVNPNTVGKAWRELEHMGLVLGRNGCGVFVTEAAPRLARALRQAATLETLRRAVVEALRVGHEPERIEALVQEVMAAQATEMST